MTGQQIGYVRVSTLDQNPERQLEGAAVDCVFADKASAKDVERPQLQDMLNFVREGDTIVVHSMDRLARKRGVYRGRKPTLSAEQVDQVQRRVDTGEKKATIARDLGISRETLYQYLRQATK
jgi:DNA invertase Pin-like site-specific DNA recombinase